MKLEVKTCHKKDLQIGFIYGLIGITGVIFSLVIKDLNRFIPPCMFRILTGIPCPACGGTRTGIYLSHLQFLKAFKMNPLFCLIFISLALWGINTLVGMFLGNNMTIMLSKKEKQILKWIVILVLPLNWLYLILASL